MHKSNIAYLMSKICSTRPEFQNNRPSVPHRKISCPQIEAAIEATKKRIADPELACLFENCFPNTLDTTVYLEEPDDRQEAFIITGDIHAMWLRDASAQIHPYLPYLKDSPILQQIFIGTIHRMMDCIALDPYANAFYREKTLGVWQNDQTSMQPGVHERKWELDSLCYFMRLSVHTYDKLGPAKCFNHQWQDTIKRILEVLRTQQTYPNEYKFSRECTTATETLLLNGTGAPSKACGLIRSAFRPSDDACTLPFHIPSNAMAVTMLARVAHICEEHFHNPMLSQDCLQLSSEIHKAIAQHGIVTHTHFGQVYAYEVDGYGSHIVMDDANVPSLLALPYLGYCPNDDPIYQNTRKLVLSGENPYYFKNESFEGIGSPHTGLDRIWPMSIIMRALTSEDVIEVKSCLKMLKCSHADTGFMHESFSISNPETFTRSWFCWANGLFAELILRVIQKFPELLLKQQH